MNPYDDLLKVLDELEDQQRSRALELLTRIRMSGARPEFVERMEKYMRGRDMLPRPGKMN